MTAFHFNYNMNQDVFIVYADALTCLGHGKTLEENLSFGKSGLTHAGAFFPDWFGDDSPRIGCIPHLSDPVERIQSILKLFLSPESLEYLKVSDSLICGSALGDLINSSPGRPDLSVRLCLREILKEEQPFTMVSSACSSGTDALALGFMRIAQRKSNIVSVLAVDSLDPFKLMQHIELKTQSSDFARPFSADRNGTSFGEGAALMLLANEAGIRKLKLKPFAKILGAGLSCDALDLTSPDESGYYPSLAIAQALASANLKPSQVNYINAHGSGTILNDLAEARALRRIFADDLAHIAVSSTKGAVGHLLGATGLVEATIAAWAIKNQGVPTTVGLTSPDPNLLFSPLCEGPSRPKNLNVALSITLGFGGVNSCIALSRI